MDLYLARHGQSVRNVDGQFYGRLDPHLTPLGQRQAQTLGQTLSGKRIDRLVTSRMQRTQETAQIIADSLKTENDFQAFPWTREADLNERDLGVWEGKTAQEIEAMDPKTWWEYIDQPFLTTPAEAESYFAFRDRVLKALFRVFSSASDGGSYFLLGHHGWLRLLVSRLLNLDVKYFDCHFTQGKIYRYAIDQTLFLNRLIEAIEEGDEKCQNMVEI
ncbi:MULTISPECIES: histidine phosphatase family protein [Aerococcus]|uniref:histidine phosphatase family protein n=1 Tax=Aerococcus urinae (strain CCUG 59500 / ACS-120-V-Col10a) TaxID=2976812 RepID=UPI000200E7CC|nr:histidine phosphatase family protein [Aerococcus sp. Group 1]AEA00577.1 phosphoglycerate mutase family protein [Aerococcus sp. Group 1]MCY3030013.1 histidine phosphatase family protein [Aerococcus sp. Group 1]MCY3054780.1 histidine phosphatase family protein [Aerococcus sp. Group 1]MCY3056510.1 histidine phosphatase family protein [Aerococcus sp. Group 1]MCY3061189.1 histidine phosphatase family protein [Aerococcus sp. Group 1]